MKRFLKCVLVGAAVACVAGVLCLLAEFGIVFALLQGAFRETGAGGIGAASIAFPSYEPFAAMLGFVAGFYWQSKRDAPAHG